MASYRAEAVDTWLRQRGWTLDRVRGSHFTYRHKAYSRSLCVTRHGRTMEAWQVRNLLDDLRRIGAAEGERENGESGR